MQPDFISMREATLTSEILQKIKNFLTRCGFEAGEQIDQKYVVLLPHKQVSLNWLVNLRGQLDTTLVNYKVKSDFQLIARKSGTQLVIDLIQI